MERPFKTEAEARAFIEGAEYVNDSSLTIIGPTEKDGQWVVTVLEEGEEQPVGN